MNPDSPRRASPSQLRRVAEGRARGLAWTAIAKQLGRPVAVVESWPRRHPKRWAQALAEAQQTQAEEAAAESLHTLRHQLRSEDDKTRREAAQQLLRYTHPPASRRASLPRTPSSQKRADQQAERPTTAATRSDYAACAEFLEGLTDAERDALEQELGQPAEASAPPAATASPDPPRRADRRRSVS